ncbi:hypothetical protein PanWU01x14_015670, partial [Parasponia andersonii]
NIPLVTLHEPTLPNTARVVHNNVQADHQFQAYQALFKLVYSIEEWARDWPKGVIILAWNYKGLTRPFAVRSLYGLAKLP